MAIRDSVARHSDFNDTMDFIPTTPYATRVLFESVAPGLKKEAQEGCTIWDPACGAGHMCRVFREYGAVPIGSDIVDHGYQGLITQDFSKPSPSDVVQGANAIVTNPPYALLNEFMLEGLHKSRSHFALLVRIQALESQSRYNNVYSKVPPTKVAIFSDRIPFKSKVVVRKAPKMFTHIWIYWDMNVVRSRASRENPELMWIQPNAQELFEKEYDYD